jgi:hypothetical protein
MYTDIPERSDYVIVIAIGVAALVGLAGVTGGLIYLFRSL